MKIFRLPRDRIGESVWWIERIEISGCSRERGKFVRTDHGTQSLVEDLQRGQQQQQQQRGRHTMSRGRKNSSRYHSFLYYSVRDCHSKKRRYGTCRRYANRRWNDFILNDNFADNFWTICNIIIFIPFLFTPLSVFFARTKFILNFNKNSRFEFQEGNKRVSSSIVRLF